MRAHMQAAIVVGRWGLAVFESVLEGVSASARSGLRNYWPVRSAGAGRYRSVYRCSGDSYTFSLRRRRAARHAQCALYARRILLGGWRHQETGQPFLAELSGRTLA